MLNHYDTVVMEGVIRPAAGCAPSGGMLCFWPSEEKRWAPARLGA